VHYHFGSRAGLISALFERRLGPMNRERLASLDELEDGGREPTLEEILGAFLAPSFRLCQTASGERNEAGERFVRILGGCYTDPEPEVAGVIHEQFAEVKQRYLPALQRALPHLSQRDLFWRMQFVLGAMARTLTGGRGLEQQFENIGSPIDWNNVRQRLLHFACAGLRAPALALEGDAPAPCGHDAPNAASPRAEAP
jgi:AcrR family transcriptional regulator